MDIVNSSAAVQHDWTGYECAGMQGIEGKCAAQLNLLSLFALPCKFMDCKDFIIVFNVEAA